MNTSITNSDKSINNLSELLDYNVNVVSGVAVINGEIVIKGNGEDDDNFFIKCCKGISLFINKEDCSDGNFYPIKEGDTITYVSDLINSKKEAKVTVDANGLKAYITVNYKPSYIYKLINRDFSKRLVLKAIKEKYKEPDYYSVEDIINILKENKIYYGIMKENLIKCTKGNIDKPLLIAKGKDIIEDIPQFVKILFKEKQRRTVDDKETVNYKEWFTMENVSAGDPLAEIIPRKEGENGVNVFGEEIKRKVIRDKPVRVSRNCHIEGNRIIANVSGTPTNKNGIFNVNNSYEIVDVNLSSGNIHFTGDVIVSKNITEGMTVKSGGNLFVGGGVYSSMVISNGDAIIRGNIIDSRVISGEIDIDKKDYIDILQGFSSRIIKLINLCQKNIRVSKNINNIGEMANLIIEKQIKDLPKLSLNIITFNLLREVRSSPLIDFIRNKIIGLNILNLKNLRELNYLLQLVDSEIEYWNVDTMIPVNINMKYAQSSIIKATGDIIVEGEGEYNSEIYALHDITFINSRSVARGGIIKAEGNISLGKVGSVANIITRLQVPHKGRITANIAYPNTIVKVGNLERIIEESCRNLEVYLNEEGEIVINYLLL